MEVDRRLRGRLHVVVVRVLRDRERLQERLRLSQVEPRVRRRRRDERAVEGVPVQALELLQRLGLTLEVERDPAVGGWSLVRPLPEQRLDRRVLGARLRVEGVGRDMEVAHVPGGVRVESLPVQALGRVRLDVGLRREEGLPEVRARCRAHDVETAGVLAADGHLPGDRRRRPVEEVREQVQLRVRPAGGETGRHEDRQSQPLRVAGHDAVRQRRPNSSWEGMVLALLA